MRKFNIIRYLKRWWPLIALMSILAGAFFMRYASNNQAYTAQAVIKYTYDAASEGLTPNGEPRTFPKSFPRRSSRKRLSASAIPSMSIPSVPAAR